MTQALRSRHTSFPEVHIRGDKNVRFEAVGRVILACQQAGIQKVGFITEPHNSTLAVARRRPVLEGNAPWQ